ncbi:MAG: glycosyltransferase [Erythrobacter sp.]|nr:glycosyltransferase [Erythrobacter sp.]
MSPDPLITIVTPSFNQGEYLERTIRSVIDQGYPRLEYIVLDGGSTDGSVDVIARYAPQLSYWRSASDGGQAEAINEGWAMARGDILAWLNSDDYLLPGALSAVSEAFRRHPQALLVYGVTYRVDADGGYLGSVGTPYRWRTLLLSRQLIPQPSAFVRRAALDQVGGLDDSLHYSMDYDFFLRVVQLAPPVMIPRPLAAATIHPAAKTTRDRDPAKKETHQVRLRHARGLYGPLVRMQPLLSRGFHQLPKGVRRIVNRARPHAPDA